MKWRTTPAGYVITSAKITRAGPVEYYGHELGLTGAEAGKKFTIYRTLEELTKPETLASFEGQTLTLTHPDSGEVTAAQWKDKAIGHIQNVRAENDYLVCDAHIKDAAAIDVIEASGVRELSCGYEPAVLVERDGQIHQINVRGNHVAVVAEGRVGADCRLNDKKGKPMKKFTIKDAIALLKGKRANDAEGVPLTEEELNSMIAALEATLVELDGSTDEEALQKIQEVTDQLTELKAQLAAAKAAGPNDADGDPDGASPDDKDVKIAALEKENAELKQQVADLQDELAKLKGEQEASSVLNDAKARFPKVDVTKAKSAREIRERVLTHSGAFNDAAVKSMSDAEIRAAYAAAQALNKPRASKLGDILLGDSKPVAKKTAAQRFGGK